MPTAIWAHPRFAGTRSAAVVRGAFLNCLFNEFGRYFTNPAVSNSDNVPRVDDPLSRLKEMTMRSLKIEELSLVAGGDIGGGQSSKRENNGLGNGNQLAPGHSLDKNGAENNVSNGGLGDNGATGNPPGSGKWGVIPN
jgi:cobalamin biosynthesis Co2+ chelatase CbiK